MRTTLKYTAILVVSLSLLLSAQTREDQQITDGMKRVSDFMQVIESQYFNSLDASDLVDGSIRGMLSQLDPHSNYNSPEQTRQHSSSQSGAYTGIGVTIGLRNGDFTVISPMENGPAERMGIRTGDIITHINGEPTSEENYNENVNQLRGERGSSVTITIRRPGMEGSFDVTVIRDHISLKTVPYAFMITGDVGYIRLTSFAQTSDREVAEAVEELKRKGMQKLVFDMRSNPGGDLTASVGVVNTFIDDGLIVYTKGLLDNSRENYFATEESTRFGGPMVVLMNSGSASGSEVVAGALQDHDRAWIVGERSWGKGLVQSQYPLSYGASLFLTTAKYYTPSGRLIQRPYTPGSFDAYFSQADIDSQNRLDKAQTVHLGRTVFGGNGISPDTELKTEEVSNLGQQILLGNHVFDFANKYMATAQPVDEQFRADGSVMQQFRSYLVDVGVEIDEDMWQRDLEFLASRITLEIVNRVAGGEAAYRAVLDSDRQLQEALRHFDDADKLLAMRLRNAG